MTSMSRPATSVNCLQKIWVKSVRPKLRSNDKGMLSKLMPTSLETKNSQFSRLFFQLKVTPNLFYNLSETDGMKTYF